MSNLLVVASGKPHCGGNPINFRDSVLVKLAQLSCCGSRRVLSLRSLRWAGSWSSLETLDAREETATNLWLWSLISVAEVLGGVSALKTARHGRRGLSILTVAHLAYNRNLLLAALLAIVLVEEWVGLVKRARHAGGRSMLTVHSVGAGHAARRVESASRCAVDASNALSKRLLALQCSLLSLGRLLLVTLDCTSCSWGSLEEGGSAESNRLFAVDDGTSSKRVKNGRVGLVEGNGLVHTSCIVGESLLGRITHECGMVGSGVERARTSH